MTVQHDAGTIQRYDPRSYTAVDLDFGIALRYVGAQESGTVEVTVTTGDMTLKHGVLGSEVADTTIDSGGDDPGEIDMSDSAAENFGKVVDLINASANWQAMLLGDLRADVTPGVLITQAEAQAKLQADRSVAQQYWGGIALYKDSTVAKTYGHLVGNRDLDGNHNGARINMIDLIRATVTNGATATSVDIYKVNDLSNVETLIWDEVIVTTVALVLDDADWGDLMMGPAMAGHGILIHIVGTGGSPTLTAAVMDVQSGYQQQPGGQHAGWYLADQ